MVVDVMISQKNPPHKIFPRSYMDFEQKYQKDPGMNRVKKDCAQIEVEYIFFFNNYIPMKYESTIKYK